MRSANLDGRATLVVDRGGSGVQRLLRPGEVLESWIEGTGTVRHRVA